MLAALALFPGPGFAGQCPAGVSFTYLCYQEPLFTYTCVCAQAIKKPQGPSREPSSMVSVCHRLLQGGTQPGEEFSLPRTVLFAHHTASCPLSSTETARARQASRKGLVLLAAFRFVSARPGAYLGFTPKGLGLLPDDLDLLSV